MVILLGLLLSLSCFGQTKLPQSYYGQEFFKSAPTKESLFKILSYGHVKTTAYDTLTPQCADATCVTQSNVGYDKARQYIFTKLYLEKDANGFYIHDIYCSRNFYDRDYKNQIGPNPNNIPASTIMNVEHTWPQSRFSNQFHKDIQKTDLHHLFPSNSRTNSERGNLMFAEVSPDDDVFECNTSNLGSNLFRDNGATFFEPPREHRGNVARALFYFSVRYRSVITPEEEYYLRKWHKEDPVDALEKNRHEEIFKIQKVRNPFIDFPELVEKLDNF